MRKKELITCDNFYKENKRGKCNGKYCDSCLQRHYSTSVSILREEESWTCFECTKTCSCAGCRRLRGENVPVKKRKRRVPHKVPSSLSLDANNPPNKQFPHPLEQQYSSEFTYLGDGTQYYKIPPLPESQECHKRTRSSIDEGQPSRLLRSSFFSPSAERLEILAPATEKMRKEAALLLSLDQNNAPFNSEEEREKEGGISLQNTLLCAETPSQLLKSDATRTKSPSLISRSEGQMEQTRQEVKFFNKKLVKWKDKRCNLKGVQVATQGRLLPSFETLFHQKESLSPHKESLFFPTTPPFVQADLPSLLSQNKEHK